MCAMPFFISGVNTSERNIATPLLVAIILARGNAYSQALATLRLSGTVPYACE